MNEIKEELYQSMMIGDLTISSDTSKQILEYIEEKDREIERLNNIINELEEYLKENSKDLQFECSRYYKDVLDKLKGLKGEKDG